jgi:heat shock protein HtpX
VLAYLLSFVIRLALSRSRAFLADAGSVELTKNPDAMISALRKIESRGELPGATSAVMEMCVDNPRQGFGELFDTHPSVENRVAALVKYAGGHDPGPIELPPMADQADADTGDSLPQGPWSRSEPGGQKGTPAGAGALDARQDGAQNSAPSGHWGPVAGAPSDRASGPEAGAPHESASRPWGPRNTR